MSETIVIKKKIEDFNKRINISGDKSLSIRWVLFASLASGVSKSKHLLMSEDVLAAINAIKKLGIKVKFNKDEFNFRSGKVRIVCSWKSVSNSWTYK